jgi:hypothetical protein
MSAYASMYGQAGMNAYGQAPSGYGPARGSYTGAGDKDSRDRGGGGRGTGGFHPYRR